MITGIVAIAANRAIGKDGGLPWHYPSDLKFFKRTTTGGAVVMGFNTWRSIGRPLPNRVNIVVSRTRESSPHDGVVLCRDKSEVLAFANDFQGDVFIIGGAMVYREFADVIDRWIVTEIPEGVEDADTFMDADFLKDFRLVETEEIGDGLRVRKYDRIG